MTKFRAYDPQIGRWWQIDPLATQEHLPSWTPYNYSYNNPIRYNDPNGDCPNCLTGMAIGILTEVTAQVGASMLLDGKSFQEAFKSINVTDVLVAGGTGFISGALDGGASKLAKFLSKKRNRQVVGFILDTGLEFIENVAKDALNDEDIDLRSSLFGAIVEAGFGEMVPTKFLSRQLKNADIDIKRLTKKANRGSKKAREKAQKKLEEAQKNRRFWQSVADVQEVSTGAVGENAGNAASEVVSGNEQEEKKDENN